MKLIAQGAEAQIFKQGSKIIKKRVPKLYRLPEIDNKIRISRTRHESKILNKINKLIPSPKILSVDEERAIITMENIKGRKLSLTLEKEKNRKSICIMIGKNLAKLHDSGIIHGDLTTSNIIYNKKVYFIDFGLGYHSSRAEDKAVDLHLIKEALEAKHHSIAKECINSILKGYSISKDAKRTLKQLEKVELRGRYKANY